jgi:pSer/pThr/pTyr-binding forkhead associated (FHA) protein
MEEKQFAGQPEVKVRCTKCGNSFAVKGGAGARTGETPAPIPEATVVSQRGGVPELPTDKKVALSVIHGPLRGKVYRISKPRVVLGRADADIVVDDPEISRKHCALEVQGIRARLIDLGSRNGTFVNEKRVEMSELQHLSEFHIGHNTFLFTITDKT